MPEIPDDKLQFIIDYAVKTIDETEPPEQPLIISLLGRPDIPESDKDTIRRGLKVAELDGMERVARYLLSGDPDLEAIFDRFRLANSRLSSQS